MRFNPFRRKWQKFVAAFLLLISSILVIGAIILNNYLWPILSSKIKEIVVKSSDGLYKVSFGEAEFHMVQGKIVIWLFRPSQKRVIEGMLRQTLAILALPRNM